MRSAIIAAAFAAGAIAVPHQKRDVVTDTAVDVVYATDVVTVTAGAEETTTSVFSPTRTPSHYGHHWHWPSQESSVEETTVAATTAPATSEAPAPTTTSTTEAAPSTTEAAPTTTAAATSAASSAAPSGANSYQQAVLDHHNYHRQNHSASNIQWSDDLAKSAAAVAASCVYAHNTAVDGGGFGQNIAAGVEGNNVSAIITDLFYNGEVGWYAELYGQAQPSMDNFEHWGHFSQIVWKDTTHVACVTQDCSAGGLANVASDVAPYFTVCNYGPPGNYANEYGANIGSPKGEPTIQWNYDGTW